jgi:hypothetical protein
MSNNNRVNTRARRLSQERRDLEEYDPSSSCSSAEGARRSALEDARDLRLEKFLIIHHLKSEKILEWQEIKLLWRI